MSKQVPKRNGLSVEEERQLNQRKARRLAKEMKQTHQGQWVGLVRGEVVAIAPTLGEVIDALAQVEPNPQRRFTFCVGEEFHKKLIILLVGR